MEIPITAKTDLNLSSGNFDPPRLKAGESAFITRTIVADVINPLYEVTKGDGSTFAVHRRYLIECGALNGPISSERPIADSREFNIFR